MWNEGHGISTTRWKHLATERQRVIFCTRNQTTEDLNAGVTTHLQKDIQTEKLFQPLLLGELSEAVKLFYTIRVFSPTVWKIHTGVG